MKMKPEGVGQDKTAKRSDTEINGSASWDNRMYEITYIYENRCCLSLKDLARGSRENTRDMSTQEEGVVGEADQPTLVERQHDQLIHPICINVTALMQPAAAFWTIGLELVDECSRYCCRGWLLARLCQIVGVFPFVLIIAFYFFSVPLIFLRIVLDYDANTILLLWFASLILEVANWTLHAFVCSKKRFDSSFLFSRKEDLVKQDLPLRATLLWLGLGALLSILNLGTVWHWIQNDFETVAIMMSFRVLGLPLILQPSVGAILLMELDMSLLSARQVELAESPSCSEYDVFYFIEEIASVKQKWSPFIHAHIVLGMIEPVAYGMITFLTLTKTQVHPEWLLLLSAAPLAMVQLCLQLVCLARFNKKIFKWQLETHNVELFRLLWQKEKELTFGVFGYRITFGKLRLSIVSFILSMFIKEGPRVLALLEALLTRSSSWASFHASAMSCRTECPENRRAKSLHRWVLNPQTLKRSVFV